jgi:hypothetical protein
MPEQADPPLFTGIRNIDCLTEDGIAGMVPHRYFQFSKL